jgi:phage replication O-like protein O
MSGGKGNPQVEDGYTKISNELLEQIYAAHFNPTQFGIIFCVIRNTYGYNRKIWKMSANYISKAIGRDARSVQREINKLIEMKVLISERASSTSCKRLGINKKYIDWIVPTYGNFAIWQNRHIAYGNSTVSTYGNSDTKLTAELPYKKRKINKENSKERSTKDLPSALEDEDDDGVSPEEALEAWKKWKEEQKKDESIDIPVQDGGCN